VTNRERSLPPLPGTAPAASVVFGGLVLGGLALLATLFLPDALLAQSQELPYPARMYGDEFPLIGSRAAIWITAQVHLLFAAFVLGVPMFAVVAEAIGIFGGEKRYDKLAKEFTRLLLVAYSATAIWGALLVFGLVTLYPGVWGYLAGVFGPSMWLYAGLFFFESFTLYLYYYGWERWSEGAAKYAHWGLGILLNVFGTIVMFIANSWLTFMMSPPAEVTPDTAPSMVAFCTRCTRSALSETTSPLKSAGFWVATPVGQVSLLQRSAWIQPRESSGSCRPSSSRSSSWPATTTSGSGWGAFPAPSATRSTRSGCSSCSCWGRSSGPPRTR